MSNCFGAGKTEELKHEVGMTLLLVMGMSAVILVGGLIASEGILKLMQTPVSYTHLDVYKRQVNGVFYESSPVQWFSSVNIEIDRKSWYYDLCDSLYILFAAAYNATCCLLYTSRAESARPVFFNRN